MKNDVVKFIDDIGVQYRIVEHPAVFTVADLDKLPENLKPIKNLLLQENDNGQKFLVVMAGDARLDLNLIRQKFNTKRLRFSDSDTLMSTFGVEPGAVSIFGLLHSGSADVKVIIDEEILKDEELGFHPNENTSTILFASKDLETILHRINRDYTVLKLY